MTTTELQNLFKPFYRGCEDMSGHGIGMTLVLRIITLHDFKIKINSKEGHGTTFSLEFK